MKQVSYLFILLFTLVLAACGNTSEGKESKANEENEAKQAPSEKVIFVDDLGNSIEFDQAPQSVATLNPGMMDILLELGANVTGRPTIHGEMAAEVAAIQDIGNPHEPSFEQIAAISPELLLVPPSFMQFAGTLEATGLQVAYVNMNSIDAIKNTITKYGALFKQDKKATQLVAEIDEEIAQNKATSTLDALVVYGVPGTYMAALDSSLYGDILKNAGGNNIASDLPALDKYPSYASLSVEKIVEGNPQLIMLITHSDPAIVQAGFEKQMSENAAWKNLDAVKNGQILILPSALFDNPGTQVVEAIEYMRNLLDEAEATSK